MENENNTASTRACMQGAKRWIVWAPDKQPFYVDGSPRRGTLDTPDDIQRLATFDDACRSVQASNGRFAGVGFALGPDEYGGHWQGIDLDAITANQLSDLANRLPGYVEMSPSGNGAHAIGYGAHFSALGSNGTGIEAYASGRYFTFTGNTIRDGGLVDLAPWAAQYLAPRHTRQAQALGAASGAGSVYVDPKTVTELRNALAYLRADDRDLWVAVGQALKELGETGRGLWWNWSQGSDKCKPEDARKWDSFDGDRTGYRAVFAKAQVAGWVNPASNAAQINSAPAKSIEGFVFRFAEHGEHLVETSYLCDPWLPRATVIGCYGRGEAGKSSWCAQLCANVSSQVTTLWISSEERQDHVRQRHLSCGGEPRTLAIVEAIPTKYDPKTKKPIATSFNVKEDLEPALVAFRKQVRPDRPLAVVVLDAIGTLVTWEKGENGNDDGAVKRLIAYLFALAEKYDVAIIMLGHLNKGSGHEHMADAVTGAAAWTTSVRLAYMFAKDMTSENYEGFVRTVKSNTGTHFGAQYQTVPVHVLRQRPDGHHDVLCGLKMLTETVWGERALREMMGDVDDRWLNKREQTDQKIHAIVEVTVQAVRQGPTTRKSVEVQLLPEKVSKRHWLAADAKLTAQGIQVTNLERGEKSYSLRSK
jgi:hypothetical protein